MPNQDLPLWKRYRRQALTLGLALALFGVLRVAFPGVDFSRGSPARWWVIGGVIILSLLVIGGRHLLRRRSDSAGPEDEAA